MSQELKEKPKVSNSQAQKELDKAEEQFKAFDENVRSLTLDRMNQAPKQESEPETKLSSRELSRKQDIYLKPERSIGSREPFNENYRKEYEFAKEYVQFIAYHKEITGETIDMWTKPFAGMACEWWKVPANKPVWGPRYLAEQIKRCSYHRLTMAQNVSTGADGMGQYFGSMAVDTTVQRLDAEPVSSRKSIFMGANNF